MTATFALLSVYTTNHGCTCLTWPRNTHVRHAYKLGTTKDGTIINSAAATVAFSCTIKALSLTQSHTSPLVVEEKMLCQTNIFFFYVHSKSSTEYHNAIQYTQWIHSIQWVQINAMNIIIIIIIIIIFFINKLTNATMCTITEIHRITNALMVHTS